MAYKIAFVSKNNKYSPASDFETFAKSQGANFVVEKIDVDELKTKRYLTAFDAVIISSFAGLHEQVVNHLASSLSLYAKCVFKTQNSGVLTQSNLVIVTDSHREIKGEFDSDKEFGRGAVETHRYSELEIERTARIAYEIAEQNHGYVTLSDAPRDTHIVSLWRKIVSDINEDYPSVRLEFESTFDTSRRLAMDASQNRNDFTSFNVILTESNNFHALSGVADAKNPLGDGTSPVAYLGETTVGLYSTERAAVGAYL